MKSIDGKYINDYGLIKTTSKDINGENTFLTSLALQCLKYSTELSDNMNNYLYNCLHIAYDEYMYNNYPDSCNNDLDTYTSPDQLIAYLCYCHDFGVSEGVKRIWDYLKSHLFTYNNVTGKTDLRCIQQPSVIFLAGYCAGIEWFKYPLLLCLCISLRTPKEVTSGKQKAFVINKCLGLGIEYDFTEALEIYYKEEDHPIRLALKEFT
jgi:hypothetical protein